MAKLSLRWYQWGSAVVVVVAGEIDASNVHRLDGYVRELQGQHDLILDLVDVTRCEPAGVAALKAAQQRADQSGWGFAVVADRRGLCGSAIQADRLARKIRTFPNRHGARAALQGSSA